MSRALSPNQAFAVMPAKEDREGVEFCLLDGMAQERLRDLFVGWWLKDQFRITLDCTQVDHLTLPEVLVLVRFSHEFACRGGFVHLKSANPCVRSLLQDLHCTSLLSAGGRAARRGRVRFGTERRHAR